MQYRHGDVMIERVNSLPADKKKLQHTILAHGEVTGHCHRIKEQGVAVLFEATGNLYLDIAAVSATVTHEEHAPISLPKGLYRVWRQREYSPQEIRIIRD